MNTQDFPHWIRIHRSYGQTVTFQTWVKGRAADVMEEFIKQTPEAEWRILINAKTGNIATLEG